ncbi:MAG: hypothetical protein PVF52_04720 [Granulosicoccaceae bacterium]|jgi:hypothetical protein
MTYAALSTPHSLAAVHEQGAVLELEDGSRWQVYAGFVPISGMWASDEMIRVKTNRNPEYPYTLINVHRNEQLEAMCLAEGQAE